MTLVLPKPPECIRVAYADPPYKEVSHARLVEHLCWHFPDGWALSTSTPGLRIVLPLCPPDVRVGAWVKPFAVFKPGVNLAYAWEPLLWRGGRKRTPEGNNTRDWV